MSLFNPLNDIFSKNKRHLMANSWGGSFWGGSFWGGSLLEYDIGVPWKFMGYPLINRQIIGKSSVDGPVI